MLIAAKCSECQSEFRFPEDWAGTEVHCAKCGKVLIVPMLEAKSEETVVIATLAEPKEETSKSSASAERSASVVGALALLLLFLMSLFGVGAFATIWIATHLGPPIRITSAPPLHAIRDVKLNVDVVKPKWIDERKARNKISPQMIIVALDRNGNFTEQRDLSVKDPEMAGRGGFKKYLVQLEKGKTYTVEMIITKSFAFEPLLVVYDPVGVEIATEVAPIGGKDARITFHARVGGMYDIHAAARRSLGVGSYTLKISTEP